MTMEIIRTERRLCLCCMEEHEVKVVCVPEHVEFKGEPVNYAAEYLYCDVVGELYTDEAMTVENDVRMKDAYRSRVGLLTSKDINRIRAKYLISQRDLCTVLGWGGKTITRYEGHQVQDRAHDSILKKIDQDPEWLLQLLTDAQPMLPLESFKKYYTTALHLYENDQDQYLRKSIAAKYARYWNDKQINGAVPLSLDKVVDVIRYFSNSDWVTNLYKVKLMKLMWYADFLSYKRRKQAITGLIYQALPMGAVPIGHDSIIDLKGIAYEEIDMGDGTGYRFQKTDEKEYASLLDNDKAIIDEVIAKLGNMSKDEIVTFMHREQAYKKTAPREIIRFEYAQSLQI